MPAPSPDTRITNGAVDTGINPLGTDSEGQAWENPKAYYQAQGKLARWQRAQSRRTTGLRRNAQHQMPSQLVHKFQNLVIEELNVAGMMQGHTPKAQADTGMGEIKRQIIYKGQWHHCEVQLAHRFYPSSKTCSNCQTVNAKLKREPIWQCPSCRMNHDRNINAAVNLRNLLTLPAGSGVMLRDGKALAVGTPNGETSPSDRRTATSELLLRQR